MPELPRPEELPHLYPASRCFRRLFEGEEDERNSDTVYHVLALPPNQFFELRPGWIRQSEHHYAMNSNRWQSVVEAFERSSIWEEINIHEFIDLMSPVVKQDSRMRTTHKIGAPKGKLP